MRWRIGLALTALLLLCVSSVSAALSNPVPTSGAYLLGDGAEVFSVDTSVPAMVGRLWIDNAGWTSYPMDCSSGLNCVATPDLTGYTDLTAYNFYFVVDGTNLPPFPAVSLFNIDRLPAQIKLRNRISRPLVILFLVFKTVNRGIAQFPPILPIVRNPGIPPPLPVLDCHSLV